MQRGFITQEIHYGIYVYLEEQIPVVHHIRFLIKL